MSFLFFRLMTLKSYHSGVRLKVNSHPHLCVKQKQKKHQHKSRPCVTFVCRGLCPRSRVLKTEVTLTNSNSSTLHTSFNLFDSCVKTWTQGQCQKQSINMSQELGLRMCGLELTFLHLKIRTK